MRTRRAGSTKRKRLATAAAIGALGAAGAAESASAQGIPINTRCVFGPVYNVFPTDKALTVKAQIGCFNLFGNSKAWEGRLTLYPVNGSRLPVIGPTVRYQPNQTQPVVLAGPTARNVDFGSLQRPVHWEACFRGEAVDRSVTWMRCTDVLLARRSGYAVSITYGSSEEFTYMGK